MSSSSGSSSQNQNPTGMLTGHHDNPGHILVQAKENAMLRICKDCKDQIFGLGSCYRCNDCDGYLHEACLNAKPNSTKPYPFIPGFSLDFSPKNSTKIHCTACCSYIEGIMYTGSHDNENYNLHPQCMDLPRNLLRARNNSKVELKLCCRMQTSLKCAVCRTPNNKGWCYGIFSNGKFEFACHVRCLKFQLVKEWLRERIPDEMPNRKAYFENLYPEHLQKIIAMSGLALKAAVLVLDLAISAFVGAPLATLLSIFLHVTSKAAEEMLDAAAEKLRN